MQFETFVQVGLSLEGQGHTGWSDDKMVIN